MAKKYVKSDVDLIAEFMYNKMCHLENELQTCKDNVFHVNCDKYNLERLYNSMIILDYHRSLSHDLFDLLHTMNYSEFR